MDPYANMGIVLKVNGNCEDCKLRLLEVLSSICGTYTVNIDAETGIADISGQVDPNIVMFALAQAGQHAELVRVKLQHPALQTLPGYRTPSNNYGMISNPGYCGYGYNYSNTGGYPINDPYWYDRHLPGPESFVHRLGTRGMATRHHYPSICSSTSYPPPRVSGYCSHSHHRSYY